MLAWRYLYFASGLLDMAEMNVEELRRRLEELESMARGQGGKQTMVESVVSTKVPKLKGSEPRRWINHFKNHLQGRGVLDALGMTEEIDIINCENTEDLRTTFGSKKVAICEKAWLALADAIQGHPVEDRVYDEKTVKAAWNIVKDWCFPKSDADLDLAKRELQGMTLGRDEEPRLFISRLEGKIRTLKSMGVEKGDGEIVRIIRRNLLAE